MKLKDKTSLLAIIGILLYIAFIILAIIFYAGGTMNDPSIPGYSFWGNTFSDTGRTVAHNGNSNIVAMTFFTIAYSSIAISFIPFYYSFPELFSEDSKEKKIAKIGSIFGYISSICFIGVVFTPADVFRPPHMIFAYIAYAGIFFMTLAYSVTLFLQDKLQKFYGYIVLIFSIFFFTILMIEIAGLNISRKLLVAGQKLNRIAFSLTFLLLAYGIFKLKI
jgi:hypothetical protein